MPRDRVRHRLHGKSFVGSGARLAPLRQLRRKPVENAQQTAPDGMPPRNKRSSWAPQEVFISYAHQDLLFVRKLAADLRRRGIRTWYSKRHIVGAQQWLDDIGAALDR